MTLELLYKPVAINNVLIVKKDESYIKKNPEDYKDINQGDMREIPEPYTGMIDSVGDERCGFKVGERVAFTDYGGMYLEMEDDEYVVLTPDMVVGILEG